MKRLMLTVAGTIVGLITLLSYRTHPGSGTVGSLPAATLSSTPTSAPTAGLPSPVAQSAVTTLGREVQTPYGTVQVKIVTTRGRIQSVAFAQLTADEQLSALINAHAAPILLQRTLAAQSADIDVVSGATYTSDGYRQSLQSALDNAPRQ